MLERLPRPTIFAHRGASAYAPENTLAAFELAFQQGADAIELDAKLTADGHVVVIHDQTVDRTTNGQGRVNHMTLAELQALDAGSHFDQAFRDEPIPTLNDVLEALGNCTYINIELTNYASLLDELPHKVADLVSQYDVVDQVLFSSFNPIALLRVHRLVPSAPIGLLCYPGMKGAWARSPLGYSLAYQALHPANGDVSHQLLRRVHRRGCRLHVYTVNQAEEMQRLYNLGVDGIFTDNPILAQDILMSWQESRKP